MNGIAILGALPGSPAADCGLKYGDVLLSVNGRAMSSVEDFLQARSAAEGRLEIIVRRGGHVLSFSLDVAHAKATRKPMDGATTMKQVSHLSLVPPPRADEPLN